MNATTATTTTTLESLRQPQADDGYFFEDAMVEFHALAEEA